LKIYFLRQSFQELLAFSTTRFSKGVQRYAFFFYLQIYFDKNLKIFQRKTAMKTKLIDYHGRI